VVAGVSGVVVDVLSEVGDTVAQGQSIARVQPATPP
jgi:multidrug efflux pump subunit AcrA (membrane-fusion protein)